MVIVTLYYCYDSSHLAPFKGTLQSKIEMALPMNIVHVQTNMDDRFKRMMLFIVKTKLFHMARTQNTDLRILKDGLEEIFQQSGALVGFQYGAVQPFFAIANIDLQEECRSISTHYWFGKFTSEYTNVNLYIFILGA